MQKSKKQQRQRLFIGIVSAASIVSLGFAIWAFIAQREVQQTLKQVEFQKTETKKALDNFIRAEIARKNIEKE